MIASSPLFRSVCQAEKTSSVRAAISDMDSSLVEVEAERLGSAVAEGEGCGAFGWVGEPVQFGEPERSVGVGDVAEHAAGADRGELEWNTRPGIISAYCRATTSTSSAESWPGSVSTRGPTS